MPALSATPRYPASLSQANRPGPSRPSRPPRPTPTFSQESVDENVPPVPRSPGSQAATRTPAKLASLADLLKQAGYKDTRVFTPEAEKQPRRVIRTTLEDIEHHSNQDDEISQLYGVFGFTPKGGLQHQRQTITEPSLPMKSSSTLLRSLALSEVQGVDNVDRGMDMEMKEAESQWWAGGIAASLGRAAKAVMAPPMLGSGTSYEEIPTNAVGLGLARGGEGVRKVKSNWELDRSRRGRSDSPPSLKEEERVIRPPRCSTDTPERYPTYSIVPQAQSIESILAQTVSAPTAPIITDDEVFGYSPLPEDYEDQCAEDEALYGDPFAVGSLGSSNSRSTISERMAMSSGSSLSSKELGLGERVLAEAVDYDDEYDCSPPTHTLVLPSIENEVAAIDGRPDFRRSSTSPEPATVAPAAEATKQLKYGDRATKLRIAKSTPVLNPSRDASWFGSIRSAVLAKSGYSPIPSEPVPAVSTLRGPMRISPATAAAPSLVTTSPVICDSASNEAEDLPAIPMSATTSPIEPTASFVPLRLRSSLAALRTKVGLPERSPHAVDGETSPMLSPRIDWKAQGSQFAGWNVEQDKPPASVEVFGLGLGMRAVSGATIDYTKSFFYKPATPPHPSHKQAPPEIIEPEVPPPQARSAPLAKRQRSIKSLRAALLIPVAPVPPVPAIPAKYGQALHPSTPPGTPGKSAQPPRLAISSPGAWEAGLPPRDLVLEGEEWDAKDGGAPGDWGRKRVSKKKSLRKKRSQEAY